MNSWFIVSTFESNRRSSFFLKNVLVIISSYVIMKSNIVFPFLLLISNHSSYTPYHFFHFLLLHDHLDLLLVKSSHPLELFWVTSFRSSQNLHSVSSFIFYLTCIYGNYINSFFSTTILRVIILLPFQITRTTLSLNKLSAIILIPFLFLMYHNLKFEFFVIFAFSPIFSLT